MSDSEYLTPGTFRFSIKRTGIVCVLLILMGFMPAVFIGAYRAHTARLLPQYTYKVIHIYPHDWLASTEGLSYCAEHLYESTGINGRSSIRKIDLETGKVIQEYDLPADYFGEGSTCWHNQLIQLTYKSNIGFIYDLISFSKLGTFPYKGEGWGLTQNGSQLIMSDGTPELRFLDPETLQTARYLKVQDRGKPVGRINELEWVKGEIFANIWLSDRIARIDPTTGRITGWIDLGGLISPQDYLQGEMAGEPNGIAYDARSDRLFVTGKGWAKLFEISLVRIKGG